MRTRVSLNEDGSIDELFATGGVHLECMGEGDWWIGITTSDGGVVHVKFHTKKLIIESEQIEDDNDFDEFSHESPRLVY